MPTDLLRHYRKIVEAALDKLMRFKYSFHRYQLGFRHGHGTELAVLRCRRSIESDDRFSAILDLKAAYDRVSRDRMITILEYFIPEDLSSQIRYFLTPITVQIAAKTNTSAGKYTAEFYKDPHTARPSIICSWKRFQKSSRSPKRRPVSAQQSFSKTMYSSGPPIPANSKRYSILLKTGPQK